MQFGDITVATVSIEDRPDLVIYLVWSPPGWRSVEVHCSQHGRMFLNRFFGLSSTFCAKSKAASA